MKVVVGPGIHLNFDTGQITRPYVPLANDDVVLQTVLLDSDVYLTVTSCQAGFAGLRVLHISADGAADEVELQLDDNEFIQRLMTVNDTVYAIVSLANGDSFDLLPVKGGKRIALPANFGLIDEADGYLIGVRQLDTDTSQIQVLKLADLGVRVIGEVRNEGITFVLAVNDEQVVWAQQTKSGEVGQLHRYNLANGEDEVLFDIQAGFYGVALSPDGRHLAGQLKREGADSADLPDNPCEYAVLDLTTSILHPILDFGVIDRFTGAGALAFTSDSRGLLITAPGVDGLHILRWDTKTRQLTEAPRAVPDPHSNRYAIAVAPQG